MTHTTEDPDARLMLLAGRGDRSAFRTLVDKYQGPLTNFLYRVVLDQAEAEDLAQNLFVRICQASGRYRPDAKFSTWLYRIATNAALNAVEGWEHGVTPPPTPGRLRRTNSVRTEFRRWRNLAAAP